MSMTEIVVIVVAVIAVIGFLVARAGGPRVTEITHTRRREKDSEDA